MTVKPSHVMVAGLAIVAAWIYARRRGHAPQLLDAGPPAPMAPPPASPIQTNNPPRSVW